MDPVSRRLVNVSVSIQLEFYYHEYDWGLIYREIGGGDNSKFYKVNKTCIYFSAGHLIFPLLQTKYNLRDYAADHADWSPRSESVSFPVRLRPGAGYHELCLAVIETGLVYYLHQVRVRL